MLAASPRIPLDFQNVDRRFWRVDSDAETTLLVAMW
jgi:hypothetical protein